MGLITIDLECKVDVADIIAGINSLNFNQRLTILLSFLNEIEWASEREKKDIDERTKARLKGWLSRKLEWIDELTNSNKQPDSKA